MVKYYIFILFFVGYKEEATPMSTITKEITLTPEEIWNAIQQLSSKEKTMLARLIATDSSPESSVQSIKQQTKDVQGNDETNLLTPKSAQTDFSKDIQPKIKYTEYPHIVRVEGTLSGEATIEGHRIGVWHIVQYYKSGMSPEEFLAIWDYITPAEYYSALAYYFDHQEEIEQIFCDAQKAYEEYQCGKIEVTEEQLARAKKGARLLVELAQSVKGKWKGDKSAVEEVRCARKRERGY
jgi:uncharacterized protein (DUF433 family)